MRKRLLTIAIAILPGIGAACTAFPDVPPDTRPLGNVTAAPQECGLISASAIKIATGLSRYKASSTRKDPSQRFTSCTISDDGTSAGERGLLIELLDPSENDAEDLENTRLTTQAKQLPDGVGPGFAGRRKNAQNETIAFVYGWTPDYQRLLIVSILQGTQNRDSLADATQFFRQLKPVLLDDPE
ncbi:hypothetical protein AB0C27_17795 [Nonomuraea sp. NPDC048882]|uniref:hypothetical protein n=1 Tax=Nonomuraea sp. NPDC048882 TaxID=3154347 RepID=UPI00341078FF